MCKLDRLSFWGKSPFAQNPYSKTPPSLPSRTLDFTPLIKDKVEQFKQFATEANNKIILEATLQERQEKQELLRERVRFIRNLDYIEKTVQVQNTREEDSRIQRNIERQQQNIQSHLAAMVVLQQRFDKVEARFDKVEAFFQSQEYKEIERKMDSFVSQNPEFSGIWNETKLTPDKIALNKNIQNEIKNANPPIENGVEFLEGMANYQEKIQQVMQDSSLSEKEKLNKIFELQIEEALRVEKFQRENKDKLPPILVDLMKDYAKSIGKDKLTEEDLSELLANIKSGKITLDDLKGKAFYLDAYIAEANINETIQKRKELQAKIATYKGEVPAHLKGQLNNLIYTEITVGVTNHILAKQKDDENLKGYQIKISSFGSDMGVISLKSKDDGQVMLDFTEAMLKVGLKNLTSENKTDINSVDDFLKNFTSENTKFTLINEDECKQAKFNDINEQYAKLRALVSYKLENKDNEDLSKMLVGHINAMRKTLISAYVNDPHIKMNQEEAERFINRMTEDEIMANNAYSAYNNVYKKEEVNQLTPYSLGVVLQKMKDKEPVSEEEKQFALDELSKQGKPLGEIKEEYPQLDRLVAKEHEAVALGNTNEQTKEIEIKEENIGVRV
ncbi:hypothetical protein HV560_07250 [Mannheimia pernigra]|uniref:Uncharacterized protein n=1 Tax=Mannheimia pernigra TaxID=111844 RepID=A0ABD7A8Q7_9PAST|nr:hypothetical protein [Mannheimia pernigra]QLB42627.1 hypothetical protein HV560_07250 [Mannheimia pernigra]